MRSVGALVAAALVLVACGGGPDDGAAGEPSGSSQPAAARSGGERSPAGTDGARTDGAADQRFPDVLAAEAAQDGDGAWRFDVTISSPYDSPDRYADAWRVVGPDGEVYGVRELTHDHASEQPFTRSLGGVEIPDEVSQVTVEGRDLRNGWGGATVTVVLVGG